MRHAETKRGSRLSASQILDHSQRMLRTLLTAEIRIKPASVRILTKTVHIAQHVILSCRGGEVQTVTKKESQFDQAEYIRSYAKENFMRVSVVLSKKYDRDIIEHLSGKNKSQYIKRLIRKDMQESEG